jgi:hypothetical protein
MIRMTYICWGVLYALCAGFGFIPEPEGMVKWAMTGLSMMFFVPGFVLLYLEQHKTVRLISAVSLGATMVIIMLNFLSVHSTTGTGDFLYALLGLVSVPMFCSNLWVLSLFLWACLLMASFVKFSENP